MLSPLARQKMQVYLTCIFLSIAKGMIYLSTQRYCGFFKSKIRQNILSQHMWSDLFAWRRTVFSSTVCSPRTANPSQTVVCFLLNKGQKPSHLLPRATISKPLDIFAFFILKLSKKFST